MYLPVSDEVALRMSLVMLLVGSLWVVVDGYRRARANLERWKKSDKEILLWCILVIILLVIVVLSGRGRPPYIGRVPQPA